jgi:transcription elongation factor GreA-like protein
MIAETEKTLIQSLVASGLKKETTTVIISVLTTKAQQETMLDWIYKHYKENPTTTQRRNIVLHRLIYKHYKENPTTTEAIQIVEAIKKHVK